jgi:hypothetical protein
MPGKMTPHPEPAIAYSLLIGAGIACFAFDLPLFHSALGALLGLDGVFLVVGGGVAMVGKLTRYAQIELLGYPLLVVVMASFGVASLFSVEPTPFSLLISLVFWSYATWLAGRGRALLQEVRITRKVARKSAEGKK